MTNFILFKDEIKHGQIQEKSLAPSDPLTLKNSPRHQNHQPMCFSSKALIKMVET